MPSAPPRMAVRGAALLLGHKGLRPQGHEQCWEFGPDVVLAHGDSCPLLAVQHDGLGCFLEQLHGEKQVGFDFPFCPG